MLILKISSDELNATWDRIEAGHPWGPYGPVGLCLTIPKCQPSEYLTRAVDAGLVTKDVALELYMASVGIGTTAD